MIEAAICMAWDHAHSGSTTTPTPNTRDIDSGHNDSSLDTTLGGEAHTIVLTVPALAMFPTSTGRSFGVATDFDTATISDILAQLRLAATEECELQIIFATIEVQAAAPAWSLQHSVIHYNDYYYIPTTSPLLQDLLDAWGDNIPSTSSSWAPHGD